MVKTVILLKTVEHEFSIIINNEIIITYQQDSKVLYTFNPNKPFGELLQISPTILYFQRHNSEFSYTEVRFTDQNRESLEIEDRINLTLVIK